MSLLSICQGALREIGELEVPTSIVGNANLTAVQMLALAQREGRELSRRTVWQALVKEKTFTVTAAAAQTGAIPSDFRYIVSATWWDRTNKWRMLGPATPQQWQALNSGIVQAGVRRWFRIRGDSMLIYPTPTNTTDTIAFEYVSDQWCETAGGTGQSAWAADTDVGVLSEELMQMGLAWRFLKAKGLAYAEELASYEREVDKAIARDGGMPTLNMAGAPGYTDLGLNIPDTGVGS